jgi:uncharacterized protein
MKPLAAAAALALAFTAAVSPAFAARTSYVSDDAHLLSSSAIAQIDQQVGAFNAETGKEVVVVTTPSLEGQAPDAALERSFAQLQVNGVEIFIAKGDKQIRIAGDTASRQFFPNGSFQTIYQAMRPYFAQGDYDEGVETGVSLIINTYRGHESSLNGAQHRTVGSAHARQSSSGGSMSWIWWLIILAVIFFVIRGIFRAISGPRMMPPGYGAPGASGPGMMGPGMGYGYGGGGGFWSGLLGGLGGAFLGNELFNRGGFGGGYGGGDYGSGADMSAGGSPDASGWQSDAGQIDTSNTGGGGWGDSGGGWGGGGDSGGGFGGGDFGGGGGDSGGGW